MFYQGILYNDRKIFAAYHDIISTDYMDEFGVQNAIFLGENKMGVIKKAQEFVRKNK